MKKFSAFVAVVAGAVGLSMPLSYAQASSLVAGGELTSQDMQVVAENTLSEAPVSEISKISDGDISTINSDIQINIDSLNHEVDNFNIARNDGNQIVSKISSNDTVELSFEFSGKNLRSIDGYILISDVPYGEPEAIIDPAWAATIDGEKITTYFKIDGNKLIQVVHAEESDKEIISDPYIRDAFTKGGTKFGQDLVFSKTETALVVAVGVVGCAPLAGWLAAGCATAPAVAGYAASVGQCLAIRAVGSKYAPNLIFPIAVNC